MSLYTIPHPLCLLRQMWRSLRCMAVVSGHDLREVDEGQPPNVQILKCDTCGAYVVGWE